MTGAGELLRLMLQFEERLQDAEATARAVEGIFSRTKESALAMLDQLAQTPLPEDLAVWESEGGAPL